MTIRVPPRIATWLLERLGPRYRSESLAGDLLEEYQQGRPPAWYWRQTFVAICFGQGMRLRTLLPRLAASALLRFLTEAAGLLGVMALSQQLRQVCASGWMVDFASIVELLAGIGLCVSLGFYISFYKGSTHGSASGQRRSTPIKRLLSVFAVTALGAGTLTWAGATPRTPQECTLRGNSLKVSSMIIPRHAELDGQNNGH